MQKGMAYRRWPVPGGDLGTELGNGDLVRVRGELGVWACVGIGDVGRFRIP